MHGCPQPAGWAIAHPRWVCIAVLSVALLVAPGLMRLELRVDGRTLVSGQDLAYRADRAISDRFGVADPIVVYLQAQAGETIYTARTLALIAEATRVLANSPTVGRDRLTSLATEGRDRLDSIDYSPFLTPLPATEQEIAALVEDIEAVPILEGTLVGEGGRGASIFVDLKAGDDRATLTREIERLLRPLAAPGVRVHVVGAPVAEVRLGEHLLVDLLYLLPLCMLMIAVVLYANFRAWWPVVLSLCEVAFAMLVVFGVLGLVGEPVYLITLVLPVILAVVGLTDEIHLLTSYRRHLLADPSKTASQCTCATLRDLLRPLTITSGTTMAAFGAFATSELYPVRSFALAAVLGVGVCWVWSVMVSPVILARIGQAQRQKLLRQRGRSQPSAVSGRSAVVARFALGPLALLLAMGMAGIPRIAVQDGWIDNLAPSSPLRESFALVNEQLHGTHRLLLEVSFLDTQTSDGDQGDVAPLHRWEVISAFGAFEQALRSDPFVGGVLGPYSHLEAIDFLAWGRDPDREFTSRSPQRLQTLWRRFEQGRGKRRRQEVASDDMHGGLITVFLERANYAQTKALLRDVDQQFAQHLAPLGAQLRHAGDVAVSQSMIRGIVANQVRSLVIAVGVIFLVLLGTFGRLREAAMGVLPVVISSLAVLGVMGWTGIPLGVATSMFCAIAIGIGTDFQVHLISNLRRTRTNDLQEDIARAKSTVAPAVIADCLVIALGFGLLAFSNVPANARLGVLVAVAVAIAGAFSLIAFPLVARFIRAGEADSVLPSEFLVRPEHQTPGASRPHQ